MNSKIISVLFCVFVFVNSVYAQDSNVYVKTVRESVIRVDSTTGADIIAKIPSGSILTKVSQAYDWYKVMLPRNTHAYVFAKYISDQSTCIATKLNVRHKADPNSYVLGSIKKDEKVVILDTIGKWYKIRAYPHSYGWIHSSRVELTDERPLMQAKATKVEKIEKVKETKVEIEESKPVIVKVEKPVVKKQVVKKLPVKTETVKVDKKPALVKKPIKKMLEKKVEKKVIKKVEKKAEKKITSISDLDAIINKHKKLKKKISNQVDNSIESIKQKNTPIPVVKVDTDEIAPYSGKLKKARRTATPAKFKLVHKQGYTLLHIADDKAVRNLINKQVKVWGEEVEDGAYTYIVVKRIKKAE